MTPEERKQQILNNAKKLFSQNGYYNTQIADIVAGSGIARGTIYNYFKNKDDIFITLLEGYCRQWQQALEHDRVDLSVITATDFLRAKIRKTLEFFAEDQYLTNIILRVGIGLPGGLELSIKRFEKIILDVVSSYLSLGIKAQTVRPGIDIEITANLISGALLRVAYHYFGPDHKKRGAVDLDRLAGEITHSIACGIFTEKGEEG